MYDEDVAGLEETLVRTLKEKGLTLSTAESCTGGLIAQRITSVPGSSEVFGYGFVTYWEPPRPGWWAWNRMSLQSTMWCRPLWLPDGSGGRAGCGAEIGISVTGVAGPTGGDALRPVGTVYLARPGGRQCI